MRRRDVRTRQCGQAMPSVVAVVSVIAIVVAMVAFFAGGNDDVAQPQAAQADAEATSTPTGAVSPETPETAARTPGSKAGDGAPARARETRSRSGPEAGEKGDGNKARAEQKKQRRTRPEPDTGPPDVYVEVYNNTSISGLAAATAAELQDAGWQVVGVDNWRGDIPASTVYYPAGFEDEARELAETIGVGRLHGAVAPMRFDRLTVILTTDAA